MRSAERNDRVGPAIVVDITLGGCDDVSESELVQVRHCGGCRSDGSQQTPPRAVQPRRFAVGFDPHQPVQLRPEGPVKDIRDDDPVK